MKKTTIFLTILLFAGTLVCEARSGSKSSPDKNGTVRIAFLGIDRENLRSNYYTSDVIAGKMDTTEEAIDQAFNTSFFIALESACTRNNKIAAIFSCCEDAYTVLEAVEYVEEGDEIRSNLSVVPQASVEVLLEKTTADYLVLIDQYYIKKEGYPYNNISHIIGYSVYDENREVVSRGRHHFTSLDIDNLNRYNKQFSKVANKMLARLGN